jgi:hypothetical protein
MESKSRWQSWLGGILVICFIPMLMGAADMDTAAQKKYQKVQKQYQARRQQKAEEQKALAEKERFAALPLEDKIKELAIKTWGEKTTKNHPQIIDVKKSSKPDSKTSIRIAYRTTRKASDEDTRREILSDIAKLMKAVLPSDHYTEIKIFAFQPYLLSLTGDEDQAGEIIVDRGKAQKLDFDRLAPNTIESVFDVRWLLPLKDVEGLYKIVKVEDLPVAEIQRGECRVQVVKSITEPQLRRISEKILEKWKGYYAVIIFFYLPGTDINDFYTAGKAVWAPNGDFSEAVKVKVGDYSKHKLVVRYEEAGGGSPQTAPATDSEATSEGYMVRIQIWDDTQNKKPHPQAEIRFPGYGSWWLEKELKHGGAVKDIALYPAGKKGRFYFCPDSQEGRKISIPFMMTDKMSKTGSPRDAIIINLSDNKVEVMGLPIKAATGKVSLVFKR